MAEPYELEVWPNSGLSFPWAEFISKAGATQEATWKANACRQVFMMIIDHDNEELAIQEILGYPLTIAIGGFKTLSRQVPMRHPTFWWLRCVDIPSIRKIEWLGYSDEGYGPISYYKYSILTLVFGNLNFPILTDAELEEKEWQEWQRYVFRTERAVTESLNAEGGSFEFVDGPGAPSPFPTGLSQVVTKNLIQWQWVDVPDNYVHDSNGVAVNINSCQGKVNDAEFSGFPAGTLYLDSIDKQPHSATVAPTTMGMEDFMPPLTWDITLNFKFFDPPHDPASANRGHNLAPLRSDPNGWWYLIKSVAVPGGGAGGATLYQQASFPTIFNGVG